MKRITPELPSAALYNTPTFVHLGKSALGNPTVWSPMPEREVAYQKFTDRQREAILSLEQNTDGLDLARVDAYRETIGAPEKPILYLDPDNFLKAREIASGAPKRTDSGDTAGCYLSDQDIILVERNPELERLNGPVWAERVAIHEVAHSSATIHPISVTARSTGRIFTKTVISFDRTRSGSAVVKAGADPGTRLRGLALEEAYAEYESGQYAKSLGNPSGALIDHPALTSEFPLSDLGNHYFWFGPEYKKTGKVSLIELSAYPAMALDALIQTDPSLLTALRASRHSVDGLRDVAKKMNALQPGLYNQFQHTELEDPDAAVIFMTIAMTFLYKNKAINLDS